jgi:hypothetical protein
LEHDGSFFERQQGEGAGHAASLPGIGTIGLFCHLPEDQHRDPSHVPDVLIVGAAIVLALAAVLDLKASNAGRQQP